MIKYYIISAYNHAVSVKTNGFHYVNIYNGSKVIDSAKFETIEEVQNWLVEKYNYVEIKYNPEIIK